MERFYDGDQEKLFAEARVINPFRKGSLISRSRPSQSSLVNILTCTSNIYISFSLTDHDENYVTYILNVQ